MSKVIHLCTIVALVFGETLPSPQETRKLLDALRRMRLVQADEAPVLMQPTGGVSSLIKRADTVRGPVCVQQAAAAQGCGIVGSAGGAHRADMRGLVT